MKVIKSVINPAFTEVMTTRKITDLTLKMQGIKRIPQDKLTTLFFEMCDWGINVYIQTEMEKALKKTKTEIMREYYQRRIEKKVRR
jgi:hypothetical protein